MATLGPGGGVAQPAKPSRPQSASIVCQGFENRFIAAPLKGQLGRFSSHSGTMLRRDSSLPLPRSNTRIVLAVDWQALAARSGVALAGRTPAAARSPRRKAHRDPGKGTPAGNGNTTCHQRPTTNPDGHRASHAARNPNATDAHHGYDHGNARNPNDPCVHAPKSGAALLRWTQQTSRPQLLSKRKHKPTSCEHLLVVAVTNATHSPFADPGANTLPFFAGHKQG